MLAVILACLAIFAVLLLSEWWWRAKTHGEVSRKFVHISVGTFVAFWPLFLSWRQIEILSVLFVLVVLASKQLNLFQTIHSVQRPTWGEIYFGIAVGAIALLTHNPAIYAASLLHMSLADGMAAIVGVKYGAARAYSILGARKSLAGSATFFVMSLVILIAYCMDRHIGFSGTFVGIALAATLLENVAVWGLDNLLVPALIAVALRTLS